MTRPEFYEVALCSRPDPVRLCRCCVAVLVTEGMLAGDPTLPSIEAEDIWKMQSAWWVGACEVHEQIRRFEERRASLGAPPQRIGLHDIGGGILITSEARKALEESE